MLYHLPEGTGEEVGIYIYISIYALTILEDFLHHHK